jgi:hypothetical protein
LYIFFRRNIDKRLQCRMVTILSISHVRHSEQNLRKSACCRLALPASGHTLNAGISLKTTCATPVSVKEAHWPLGWRADRRFDLTESKERGSTRRDRRIAAQCSTKSLHNRPRFLSNVSWRSDIPRSQNIGRSRSPTSGNSRSRNAIISARRPLSLSRSA